MVVKRKSSKNPPIFSHEFVIQNHADIVACVAMVFVVGLMFQVSSPLASLFIALHHNVTVPVEVQAGQIQDVTYYAAGIKDFPAIFFYLLIAIVMHQIIQEYLLDRVNRYCSISAEFYNVKKFTKKLKDCETLFTFLSYIEQNSFHFNIFFFKISKLSFLILKLPSK